MILYRPQQITKGYLQWRHLGFLKQRCFSSGMKKASFEKELLLWVSGGDWTKPAMVFRKWVAFTYLCHEIIIIWYDWPYKLWKPNSILREGNGNPLQYSCLENSMDGGAWQAEVHGVTKSQTWLSDFTFTFHFHALEKEMATHSRILAWRIPGTAEPGGLPSIGSHRVGHDWSDLAVAAAIVFYY